MVCRYELRHAFGALALGSRERSLALKRSFRSSLKTLCEALRAQHLARRPKCLRVRMPAGERRRRGPLPFQVPLVAGERRRRGLLPFQVPLVAVVAELTALLSQLPFIKIPHSSLP